MVDRAEAMQLAQEFIEREVQPSIAEEVILTRLREFPDVWVAGYNTRAFVETGSIRHALAGGGPILIAKKDGTIELGTSALPVEDQVAGAEIIEGGQDG